MAKKKPTPAADETKPETTGDTPDAPDTVDETEEEKAAAPVPDVPVPAPAPQTPLNPEKVIKVDFHATGGYVVLPAPKGWYYDRRLTLSVQANRGSVAEGYVPVEVPQNFEHVENDADGVWCYRRM
jgi:hypothetical protein